MEYHKALSWVQCFFLLYVNDLESCLDKIKCVLFADDTTVYHSGTDIQLVKSELEYDLSTLNDWLLANKLSLSISKTNFLHFKRNKTDENIEIKFGDHTIKQCQKVKILGIWIDDQLKWNAHAEYIMQNNLPNSILRTVYFSLIESHLQYGLVMWGGAYDYILNPIRIQQKKAFRIVDKITT